MKRVPQPELYEPAAHAPLVLEQQHRLELGEAVGRRLVERQEHGLAIVDRQPENPRSERQRLLELLSDFRGAALAEDSSELERVAVGDGRACELHLRGPTRREVLALELSRLRRGEPSVIEQRVNLVRERFVADRERRDLRVPVQPCPYVRVHLGAAEAELRDFCAESVRTLDHGHEFVIRHHANPSLDVSTVARPG